MLRHLVVPVRLTGTARSRSTAAGPHPQANDNHENLIKHKKTVNVEYKKSKDARRIVAGGQDAFVQTRADAHGKFVNDFADLALP